jgi:hypothetical protein
METEQWWKRHSQVDLGGYDKEDIENLTGSIPLLLDQCMVNGKIDLDPLTEVGIKAATFVGNIRKKTKDVGNYGDWNLYVHLV